MNRFVKRVAATLLLISWFMSGAKPSVAQDSPQRAAQPLVPSRSSVERGELITRLEGLIPQLMKEGLVPGLSVALIQDSKVVWHCGFGVKNAATKEVVDDDTVFEAASLSKPVFAYAVLKLVEGGKLNLDTPLNKYLPGSYVENDERLNLITGRRVLSHTTGFRNWRPRGGPLKIYFTPGERFSYSGEGFVYLQKVVEHLTGEPLDLFMRKTVFEPLQMTSSSYVWLDKYDTLKATGHDQSGSPTSRRKPSQANAAASLQTTALDYAKFVVAVLNGTGLRQEMIKEMLGPQIRVDESCTNCTERKPGRLSPSIGWGLGWGLEQTAGGESFWHWGDNGDVHCYVVALVKQKTGVLIFTNSGNGLSIIPDIVERAIGGPRPAFAWIRYDRYNSPARMIARDILARGEAAIKEYRERRKTDPGAGVLNEDQMNSLGYSLLRKKMVKEAIEVFRLNVEEFPTSFNVYDSLGEAYMASGDRELAIKNYKKSIELNPDNTNGIEMLKKLEGK